MSPTQHGERVRASETVRGESVGHPRRGPTDNDVIVYVCMDRMLRDDFRDFFSSTRCDVEQSGFRLVELVGRRHRELVDELILGNVKPEILSVDGPEIFWTGRRASIRRRGRRRLFLEVIVVGKLLVPSTSLPQMLVVQFAAELVMEGVGCEVDRWNDLLGR
jgi:hypothetical protein